YGNASGGVIELFTADAPPVPTLGAGFVAGANGLRKSSLSFHTPWGADDGRSGRQSDLLLDLVDIDSDGYRDHSTSHRTSGQALLRGAFGEGGRYTLLFNGLDLTADDPQGLTAAQVRDNRRAASDGALTFDTRKTVRQDQFGARVEHTLSAGHEIAVTAWAGNRATTQMLSVPVAVQRDNPLHNGGAIDLDRDYPGIDVGVVGALRRDERNRVTANDVYLQAEWAPAERWRLHVGVRRSEVEFESDDRFVTAINPDDSGALEYARTSPVAGVLFRA